jgi:hypothetical protein
VDDLGGEDERDAFALDLWKILGQGRNRGWARMANGHGFSVRLGVAHSLVEFVAD